MARAFADITFTPSVKAAQSFTAAGRRIVVLNRWRRNVIFSSSVMPSSSWHATVFIKRLFQKMVGPMYNIAAVRRDS